MGHYIGDYLLFPGYDFETSAVSNTVAKHVKKRRKVGGSVVLGVPSRDVASLEVASYAYTERCELAWNRLNGEADEEEVPRDDDTRKN